MESMNEGEIETNEGTKTAIVTNESKKCENARRTNETYRMNNHE